MKKILITGVGGFIGSNLMKELNSEKYEIWGTYRKSYSEVLRAYSNIHLVKCDLNRNFNIDEKFDCLIHAAGQIKGNIPDYLDNNIRATENILNYAQKTQVKKFIYLSTISIYGETHEIITESSDRVNLDSYGMTKYLSETLVENSSLNTFIIRLPRMIGKGIDMSYPWIPLLTKKLLRNEQVTYFNPNLNYNNVLHLDNLIDFIRILLENNFKGSEKVVLSSKEAIPVLQIIKLMKQQLGSSSELLEVNSLKKNKVFYIAINKALQLGFNPYSVESALELFCHQIKEE